MLFLLALMGALMLTNLGTLAILGIMAAGWLIAVAFEWAATREETHYGSGLPPRYYVPQVSLPPARPLEGVGGYPEQRDEAPTWIASAAMREELLGAWPGYAGPETRSTEPEQPAPEDDAPGPDAEQAERAAAEVESPGAAPLPDAEAAAVLAAGTLPVTGIPTADLHEPGPVEEEGDTDESASAPAHAAEESDSAVDGDNVPEPDVSAPRRRRFWQRDTEPDADPWQDEELPLESEPAAEASEPAAAPVALGPAEPAADVPLPAVAAEGVARHSLDPLAGEPERGRRPWQRGQEDAIPSIEVHARPAGPRALPRHATPAVPAGGEE